MTTCSNWKRPPKRDKLNRSRRQAREGQPEGSAEDTSEEPEQTEGEPLLGKFKSVEDLAKSYQELERKLGSRDDEKEQLRQQLYMLQGVLAGAAPNGTTAADA